MTFRTNLFAMVGTHGTGKTTVSKELERRGFAVNTKSIPRTVQERLGWKTLRRVEESEANLWAMQDMVVQILRERDAEILQSNVITFVDRSPVDFVGYTYVWASRLDWKIDMDRYREYVKTCAEIARANYGMQFFFPIREEIVFVPEHNRGDEASRELNEHAMCCFINEHALEYRNIHTLKVEDRANEVLEALSLGMESAV